MTVESGAPSGVRQCGSPQVPPSVLRFCSAGLRGCAGEGGGGAADMGFWEEEKVGGMDD